MTSQQPPDPAPTPIPPLTSADFRWQSFFRRAAEPFFLLDRRRRILFVNPAWEQLTGLSAARARGLACRPGVPTATERGWEEEVTRALAPPPEVPDGQSARVRRLLPGTPLTASAARQWWDVEFFPLRTQGKKRTHLLAVLGKITPVHGSASLSTNAGQAPVHDLPERLAALREDLARRLPAGEVQRLWQPEDLLALRHDLADRYRLELLPAESPALRRVVNQVRLAAHSRAAVLLVGEAGTGKHWLARAIHHHGVTREQPFAALDCAHLPPAALASALSGEIGLLRQPGLGTLYLKEPARLPLDLQARLCEYLADAGPANSSDRPRLAAGCRTDPGEDVRAGRLLADLHAALSTLVIELPPLRERLADLPLLALHFLERSRDAAPAGMRNESSAGCGLTPEAWDLVRAYPWPGNLRELAAVLAACVRRRDRDGSGLLDAKALPAYLRLQAPSAARGAAAERALPLDQLLEQAERRLIQLALRRCQGNKSKAAALLAIWRQRLMRRMAALGIADPEAELEIREVEEED